MARPTNKKELIEAAEAQFSKLTGMIGKMNADQLEAPFAFDDRDRNVRDVLVHLHEWHLMMERWYREGTVEGSLPAVPGEGYTWKTLPALNMEIWKRYQEVPLSEAQQMLRRSHRRIMDLIGSHTDEELFSRGVYKWTKKAPRSGPILSVPPPATTTGR